MLLRGAVLSSQWNSVVKFLSIYKAGLLNRTQDIWRLNCSPEFRRFEEIVH